MTEGIRYIYKDAVNEYKIKCNKVAEKAQINREDINDLRFRYYILYHMFLKYGCPECGQRSCNCGILPNKHGLISNAYHDGLAPWTRQEHDL